jgi:hypothetical protein
MDPMREDLPDPQELSGNPKKLVDGIIDTAAELAKVDITSEIKLGGVFNLTIIYQLLYDTLAQIRKNRANKEP